MRKRLWALALAAPTALVLLTACSAEDSTFSSEDVRYRELSIDGFTNYWLTLKVNADSVHGDSLFVGGRVYALLDKSWYKEGSLPKYKVDSLDGKRVVFYQAKEKPSFFSCERRYRNETGNDSTLTASTVLSIASPEERVIFVQPPDTASGLVHFGGCPAYYPGLGFQFDEGYPWIHVTIRY